LPKFLTNQNFWGYVWSPCTPTSCTTAAVSWFSSRKPLGRVNR